MNTLRHASPVWMRSRAPWVVRVLLTTHLLGIGMASASPTHLEAHARPALSNAAAAEPSIELEQLIGLILSQNTELQASQNALVTAALGIQSAQALPNPRLELNQGQNMARLPGVTQGHVQIWSVSQLIENPSARHARVSVARAHEQASAQHVNITRNELVSQIRLRAYQALQHQAQSLAAGEALQLLEEVRERVRLRVASGEAARYEIIKADAEIINARERFQTSTLMAEQALLELNRLAAGRLPARWKLIGNLHDETTMPSLEKLQEMARQNNPELSALRAAVEQAKAQMQAAQASRWPGVEVRYSQSRDPEIRQGLWSVGAHIPLLDQRRGPVAQAQSELVRANARLEGRQAELEQQVLLAWKSIEMARLRIEALSQGAVREAEAAVRVAQAAYRFGERGILDVLDAQRVLRHVRTDLIDARFQLQTARVFLDQLTAAHARTAQ